MGPLEKNNHHIWWYGRNPPVYLPHDHFSTIDPSLQVKKRLGNLKIFDGFLTAFLLSFGSLVRLFPAPICSRFALYIYAFARYSPYIWGQLKNGNKILKVFMFLYPPGAGWFLLIGEVSIQIIIKSLY